LERLNERYTAWPVQIHRPTLITQGYSICEGNNPGSKLMTNFQHYSSLLQAVPDLNTLANGSVNLVDAEKVASDVVNTVKQSGPGPVRLFIMSAMLRSG